MSESYLASNMPCARTPRATGADDVSRYCALLRTTQSAPTLLLRRQWAGEHALLIGRVNHGLGGAIGHLFEGEVGITLIRENFIASLVGGVHVFDDFQYPLKLH